MTGPTDKLQGVVGESVQHFGPTAKSIFWGAPLRRLALRSLGITTEVRGKAGQSRVVFFLLGGTVSLGLEGRDKT